MNNSHAFVTLVFPSGENGIPSVQVWIGLQRELILRLR
jgi:hypothetical protein